MPRRKRKFQPAPPPFPRYYHQADPYRYGDGLERADAMRKRLLSEAEFLTGIGDSRGERLRSIALELPFASLERMRK